MRSMKLAVVVFLIASCGGAPKLIAKEPQTIWFGDKEEPSKINTNISHWRSDLEAQLLLRSQAVIEGPAIASISPDPTKRGKTITIQGTNFNRMLWFGGSYRVSFQADAARALATPISTTNTQIEVTVPANATTGLVRLVSNSGGLWAERALPLTIIIPPPTTGVARFTNNSQFEVHLLTMNGQPMIPSGQVLPPGSFLDVVGPGGPVPFHAELGFGLQTYFTFLGAVQVVNGQTAQVSIPRVTAADALTLGNSSAIFDGSYADNNFSFHIATIVFYSNGVYDLFDDGFLVGSSTYTDGRFQSYLSEILFSADGRQSAIDIPYTSFILQNGPPTWPNIQYIRR